MLGNKKLDSIPEETKEEIRVKTGILAGIKTDLEGQIRTIDKEFSRLIVKYKDVALKELGIKAGS